MADRPGFLSKKTVAIVQKLFPPAQQEGVAQLLETECGNNLPFAENWNEPQLERVRFAVLKLCMGNIDVLLREIVNAQRDWRDTLMQAGFGYSLTEHEWWAKEFLDR